jgi:hypothetical protein
MFLMIVFDGRDLSRQRLTVALATCHPASLGWRNAPQPTIPGFAETLLKYIPTRTIYT